MRIQRIDSQNVKLGDYTYNTGAVYADYRGDLIDFYHKNGGNSFPIEKGIKYTSITNSAGVAFGTIAETSAAIAAAIAAGDGVSSILSDKGTVSQATSTGTAVTLNNLNGVISTFAQTLAADGTAVTFTVNNSKVNTASNIQLTCIYPLANTGTPVVSISSIANGSFVVEINNPGTAALNGALKIGFLVA